MFNGKFISRNSGISKKSGKEYYKIEFIAATVDGGTKVLQSFCTKAAFDGAQGLAPMQDCKVLCGVTENGFLTICGVKAV